VVGGARRGLREQRTCHARATRVFSWNTQQSRRTSRRARDTHESKSDNLGDVGGQRRQERSRLRAQLAPREIDAEMLAVRNGFRTPRAERDTTLLSMNSTGLNEGVPTIGVAYGFP